MPRAPEAPRIRAFCHLSRFNGHHPLFLLKEEAFDVSVFVNGSFVAPEKAVVSVEDRGYQFADGIYEVVLIWGGRYRFMDRHLQRLVLSAEGIELPLPFGPERFEEVAGQLLRESPRERGTLYIQVSRGAAPRDHQFPKSASPSVVMYLKEFPSLSPALRSGAPAIILPDERWLRCSIKSISLLPNIIAKEKAVRQGAKEAVLQRDGFVTEGASSNVFMVKDGTLLTHPATVEILDGITRQVVLELARSLEIPVEERRFTVDEFLMADEAFFASTTSFVHPISRVGSITISDAMGPVTEKLQRAYFDLIDQPEA